MTARAATIKSIRIVHEEEGEALEILSTRPLIPSIQEVRNPDRLVIDLPNARVGGQPKKVEVNADQIGWWCTWGRVRQRWARSTGRRRRRA
jgi:hypothetical protein